MHKSMREAISALLDQGKAIDKDGFVTIHHSFLENLRMEYEAQCKKQRVAR
jgi:hypothetical protein